MIKIAKLKSATDIFFACHLTASAAVALLWYDRFVTLPSFSAGLAAGLIGASILAMFLTRASDEYTLANWHAGTSAGFGVIAVYLVVGAFSPGIPAFGSVPSLTAELSAMTAYLLVVGFKRWQSWS